MLRLEPLGDAVQTSIPARCSASHTLGSAVPGPSVLCSVERSARILSVYATAGRTHHQREGVVVVVAAVTAATTCAHCGQPQIVEPDAKTGKRERNLAALNADDLERSLLADRRRIKQRNGYLLVVRWKNGQTIRRALCVHEHMAGGGDPLQPRTSR